MQESLDSGEQSFPAQSQFAIAIVKQRLLNIDRKMLQDPDYLQKLPRAVSVTLHKPTPAGGKFWHGSITEAGVHLHWGRHNTNGSSKSIGTCVHGSRAQELLYRAIDKLQKGYTIHAPATYLPK